MFVLVLLPPPPICLLQALAKGDVASAVASVEKLKVTALLL